VVVPLCVHIRTMGEQQSYDVEISTVRGFMKWSRVVIIPDVYVRTTLE
jgi:hypothetical protein